MSTDVRQELAGAASTVEGITAHPYYVQDTSPGHTFIRLERVTYPNRFGGLDRWNVVVVLPQDLAEAEKFFEDHIEDLYAALAPHLAIDEAVLQQLNITGVGILPCVFINGHRERD